MEKVNVELQQAKDELRIARERSARALLKKLDQPNDPNAIREYQNAVNHGKATWERYQIVATARLADEISAIIPGQYL